MNGHKDPNDSHNYHDENHDEIELYQVNSNRNLMTLNTRTTHTPKTVLETMMGCCWPLNNVTWYLYPYYDIKNTELYNWNVHLKHSIPRWGESRPTRYKHSLVSLVQRLWNTMTRKNFFYQTRTQAGRAMWYHRWVETHLFFSQFVITTNKFYISLVSNKKALRLLDIDKSFS